MLSGSSDRYIDVKRDTLLLKESTWSALNNAGFTLDVSLVERLAFAPGFVAGSGYHSIWRVASNCPQLKHLTDVILVVVDEDYKFDPEKNSRPCLVRCDEELLEACSQFKHETLVVMAELARRARARLLSRSKIVMAHCPTLRKNQLRLSLSIYATMVDSDSETPVNLVPRNPKQFDYNVTYSTSFPRSGSKTCSICCKPLRRKIDCYSTNDQFVSPYDGIKELFERS